MPGRAGGTGSGAAILHRGGRVVCVGMAVEGAAPPGAGSDRMAPTRVVIFAKAPLAGLAKTRLIPALGMAGSAALATTAQTLSVRAWSQPAMDSQAA